jgi:putative amide transporter protein
LDDRKEKDPMLLGVMLLYVGAVLIVNGVWLIGQARATALGEGGATAAVEAGGAATATTAAVQGHPTFIQNREITVLNIFTGFVGVAVSVTLIVQGNSKGDLASVRAGGFILLFAFTYLWVAFNGYLNAGGRGFGWYCLFVAVTAVAAGIYTFRDAAGNTASIWLGIDWMAWAVLWFLFFLLLALDRPIARFVGAVAILEGIATSWVFGFLLLEGTVKF